MAPHLAPGSLIGKYTVERLLAVGGSAEVYLVRSHGIEGFAKLAVVKRLLPHLVGHPDFAEMFLDEARLAANLRHPNIAQIFDFGRTGQSHFIAMEYVEGESLSNVIRSAAKKQRGFSLGNSLRVVQSVAAGLHYAHQLKGTGGRPLGIVHRDVSPHNVMITFDGSVKLVDFGIATAQITKRQSLPGTIKGNLRYMSPEQCAGEPLDCRSDLFSLGVLLFELTTGTRLHRGHDDRDIARRILHDPVPMPSARRKDYPPELERIVMTALQRDPARRYATAQELQVDLETFARDRGVLPSNVDLAAFMVEVFGERKVEAPATLPPPAPADDPTTSDAAQPSDSRPLAQRRRLRIAAALAAVCVACLAALWGWVSRKPSPVDEARVPSGAVSTPTRLRAASEQSPPSERRAFPPAATAGAGLEAGSGRSIPVAIPQADAAAASRLGGRAQTSARTVRPRAASRPGQPSAAPGGPATAVPASPSGTVPADSKPTATSEVSSSWTLDSPLPP